MQSGYSPQQMEFMGLGAAGAGLGGLFSNQQNPYNSASPYLNQVPGTISPYYNPYIQAGQGALGQLQGQYGNMINNPMALYNKVASGYQASPGYQWQLGQGLNAINNVASAGGMAGSPQHQQQAGTLATGLANQDYYNYLNNALGSAQGMYGAGIQGLQGLGQMGLGASNELANSLGNNLLTQGNLAFSGQAAQNQAQGQEWGSIFGGLGSLLPYLSSL
jgi:hypothetical protein